MATAGATIASSATVADATSAVTAEDAIATSPAIAVTDTATRAVSPQTIADVRAADRLSKPTAAMEAPAVMPRKVDLMQQ
jgi:hypothetical protein